MTPQKNQNYLYGAAILAGAVVIVKILGGLYKLPMSDIMGNTAFGYFNVAYNLYNVLLALSTAGLPVALAKMIAEANSLGRPMQVRKIFSTGLIAFIVLGTLGTAAMLAFPTELAIFMENESASQSIAMLAPSVLLCCVMSAFRGYTQGLSDMRPTAVSQIIEVGAKVVFGLAVLLYFAHLGKSGPILSAGAISGVSVGSLVACVVVGIVAAKRMKLESANTDNENQDLSTDKRTTIVKSLIKIGIPIAFGACVVAIVGMVNTKLIISQLQSGVGMSRDDATGLFGVYSLVLTLYGLPGAIVVPLSVSVIPAISGAIALDKMKEAREVTESSLRIATILMIPMAVGLSVLAKPIMGGLFESGGVEGAGLLAIMGISSFFFALSTIMTAILQANGHERLPAVTIFLGGVANVAVNWYLIALPQFNIYGAAIGLSACNLLMFILNLAFVMIKLPEKPSLKRVFLRPVINAVIMGVAAYILYPAFLQLIGAGPNPSRIMILAAMVAAIAIAAVVYIVLTITTKAVTMDDMVLIPGGGKLAKLLRVKEN